MAEPIKLPPLPPPRVDVINLIDVLITLIAFFMLTSVFGQRRHQLDINLPAARQRHTITASRQVVIELNKQNQIFYEGRITGTDQLEAWLSQKPPETGVIIRADRDCRYEWIIHLLDLVKNCKLSKVAFEVKK
jgi:biopolymer transport protein ExbD